MDNTQNHTENDNKSSKRSVGIFYLLYCLIVWAFSMSCIGYAILYFAGDQTLPPEQRIRTYVMKSLKAVQNGTYFNFLFNNLNADVAKNQGLKSEKLLKSFKSDVSHYITNINPKTVSTVIRYSGEINKALDDYNKAMKDIAAWRKGEQFTSTAVNTALDSLTRLKKDLDESIARSGSYSNTPAENSEILGRLLFLSGSGFEYRVDEFGFSDDKKRMEINGYWRYDPSRINFDIEKCLELFGLTRTYDFRKHDLCVRIIKDDNGAGTAFWTNKKAFDIPVLSEKLGFKQDRAFVGAYSRITIPGNQEINIPCNRISCHEINYNRKKVEIIVVDLRRQPWCKWNTNMKSKNDYFPSEGKVKVEIPLYFSTDTYNKVFYMHVKIKNLIQSNLAKDVMPDPSAAAPLIGDVKTLIKK